MGRLLRTLYPLPGTGSGCCVCGSHRAPLFFYEARNSRGKVVKKRFCRIKSCLRDYLYSASLIRRERKLGEKIRRKKRQRKKRKKK